MTSRDAPLADRAAQHDRADRGEGNAQALPVRCPMATSAPVVAARDDAADDDARAGLAWGTPQNKRAGDAGLKCRRRF